MAEPANSSSVDLTTVAPSSSSILCLAAIVLLTAAFSLFPFASQRSFFYDDSFITLRYAQNLANGYGLVYNPGEHVEGFSNLLWVVLLGLLHKVTGVELLVLAKWTGFAILFLSLFVAGLICLRIRPQPTVVDLALLLLCLPLSIVVPSAFLWAISGLETSLYAFALLTFVYFLISNRLAFAAVALWLASVTRPEAVIFAVVVPCLFLDRNDWANLYARRFSAFVKPVFNKTALFLVIFLLGMMATVLFRLLYFHAFVPNTVVLKASGDLLPTLKSGLTYVSSFGKSYPAFTLFFSCSVLIVIALRSANRAMAYPICAILLLQILLVIKVGGDWMSDQRFFASFIPLMTILIWQAMSNIAHLDSSRFAILPILATASLMICMFYQGQRFYQVPNGYSAALSQSAVALGKWLKLNSPPDKLVAVGDAGAIPYYSELKILDLHGLMDRHIASSVRNFVFAPHTSVDCDYVFSKKPDWIVIIATNHYPTDHKSLPVYGLYGQLLNDRRFADNYEFAKEFPFNDGYRYHLYYNRRTLRLVMLEMDAAISDGESVGADFRNGAGEQKAPIKRGTRAVTEIPFVRSPHRSIFSIGIRPTDAAGAQIQLFRIRLKEEGKLLMDLNPATIGDLPTTDLSVVEKSPDYVKMTSASANPQISVNSFKLSDSQIVTSPGPKAKIVPELVSFSPATGSGSSATFSVGYKSAGGGADILATQVIIGSNFAAVGSCWFGYDRNSNGFFLLDDAGKSSLLGASPGHGSISNSHCTILGQGSSAKLSDDQLNVSYHLKFKQGFAGPKHIWTNAYSVESGLGSSYQSMIGGITEAWTVTQE